MARPTPATIRYKTNVVTSGDSNDDAFDDLDFDDLDAEALSSESEKDVIGVIPFHAVIFEDHQATTEITKFPVQTGFEVTDHAIRKNRAIKIDAIITNTPIEGSQEGYGSNNSRSVFDLLNHLVQSAIPCEVTTNLGIYYPVVFTSFKTKQQQGMTDAILVHLNGEELQVKPGSNSSAPSPLIWEPVPEAGLGAAVDRLIDAGIVDDCGTNVTTSLVFGTKGVVSPFVVGDIPQAVSNDNIANYDLFTAQTELGTDFTFTSLDSAGNPYELTYVCTGWDGADSYSYEVHTSNTDVYIDPNSIAFLNSSPSINDYIEPNGSETTGALNGVTACMIGCAGDIVNDVIDNTIDTALGELQQTVHGALQDVVNLGGSEAAQALIGTTLDCVAGGVSDLVGSGESGSVDDLIGEGITGVKGIGNSVTDGVSEITTKTIEFTKIVPKGAGATGTGATL